jgi:hypothetical protein
MDFIAFSLARISLYIITVIAVELCYDASGYGKELHCCYNCNLQLQVRGKELHYCRNGYLLLQIERKKGYGSGWLIAGYEVST